MVNHGGDNASSQKGKDPMSKLVQAYIANPSDKNLARLRAYAAKHPFGIMALNDAELKAIDGKVW